MINKSIIWKLVFLALVFSISNASLANPYDPSATVFRFQKKMAERGNPASQFKLGLMYETGSGVERSLIESITWYKKADKQDYKPASNRLIYLEIKKSGFNDSHHEWLSSLKNDARFNEGEALFLLGQMYSEGTGVNKSLTQALKLLRKAAGGNIPGSDTEMQRVERELAELQQQFLTEEDKKNLKPVIPPKKSKTALKRPGKPKIAHKPVTTKTQISQSIDKNKQIKQKKLAQQKALSDQKKAKAAAVQQKASAQPLAKSAPAIIPVEKQQTEITDDLHPMDTICGGRNRFLQGCR